MGDAISHAVLPGVVLAYAAGLPLAAGAFAAGMGCALATGYLKENSRVKEDTVMGVVFSGMFGLGIVLFSFVETELHLDHILFGDILGLTWPDVGETALIAAIVLAFVGLLRRDLLVCAFDATHARAIGLPVRFYHYGLLAVLSLAIVGALKSVGIILAVAMLIAPGAIASEGLSQYPEHATARFRNVNPQRRMGNGWDIAEGVAYLSSDAGNFITGEVLTIDGGMQMWGTVWPAGVPEHFNVV